MFYKDTFFFNSPKKEDSLVVGMFGFSGDLGVLSVSAVAPAFPGCMSAFMKAARIPLAKVFLAFNTGWYFTSFTNALSRS